MARLLEPPADKCTGHKHCCEHASSLAYIRAVELLRVRGVSAPSDACCLLRPSKMTLRSLDGEQDMGAIRCWAGSAGEPLFLLVASKHLNATANAAAFEIHLPTGVPLSLPGLANYGVASYCAALGQLCAQVAANAAADVAGGSGPGYAAADDMLAGDAVRGAEPPCQQQQQQQQRQQQQNLLSPPSDWLDVLLDAADLIEGYEGGAASAWSWCSGGGGCPIVAACNTVQELAQQQQQQQRGLAVAPVRVIAYVGFMPPPAAGAASLSPLLRVQGSAAFTAAAAAASAGAGSSSSQRPPCALSAPAVSYAAATPAAASAAAAAIPAAARANAATAAEALWTRRNLDAPAVNDWVALLPVDDIRLSAPAAAGMAPRQPGAAAASADQPSYAPQTYAHPHQQPCQPGWAWYQPCPKPQSCHAAVATAPVPVRPLRWLPPSRVGLAAAAAAAGCAPLAPGAMASVEVTCVGDLLRAADGAAGCSPGGGGAAAPHWLPAHDAGICGSRSHTGFTPAIAAPWPHGAQVHGAAPAAAALPAGGSAMPCARAPLADLLPCDGVDWHHAHVAARGSSGSAHSHPLHHQSDPVVVGGARRPGPTAGPASSRGSAGPDMATAAAPAAAGAPPPLSPHWPPAAQMLLPIPFGVSQGGGGEGNSSEEDDGMEGDTGRVVECEGADVAADAWDTDSLGGWEAEHGGGGGGGRCGGPNDYNDCALLVKCMGALAFGTRSGGGSGGGGDEGGCGLPRGAPFFQSGTGGAPDACGGGAATAVQPRAGDDDAALAATAAAVAAAVSLDAESFQGLFEECLDDYDVYQVLCRIGGAAAAAATADGADCGAGCGAPGAGCLTMRMPGPSGVATHPDQGDDFGSSSSFAQGAERIATGARCGSFEALGLQGGQLAGRMCA